MLLPLRIDPAQDLAYARKPPPAGVTGLHSNARSARERPVADFASIMRPIFQGHFKRIGKALLPPRIWMPLKVFYHRGRAAVAHWSGEAGKRHSWREVRRLIQPEFDSAYYLSKNPDVGAARVDPVEHFVACGWREGRRPHIGFDPEYYLRANPDVARLGTNPFYHFLANGRAEGRLGVAPSSAKRRLIALARAPRERIGEWGRPDGRPTISPGQLHQVVHENRERVGLVLSVSHDDYTAVAGGVQNCVGDEQLGFGAAGWMHLHLSPAQPLPMLSYTKRADDFPFAVTVDGTPLGTATATAVRDAVEGGGTRVLVIHHLLGHSPEVLWSICEKLKPSSTYVWAHDFLTICENYALLRNDVEFCWGPSTDSAACRICVYGPGRRDHLTRISRLFDLLDPVVLTPSKAAHDLWVARSRLRHKGVRVVPHAELELAHSRSPLAPERPLRVAFVGAPVAHKGWHAYERIAALHAHDARYEFLHFGSATAASAVGVRHVPASVTRDDRGAMSEALKREEVDVVVAWSLCYETFSFTTYEAIAAGAFVLARAESGNQAVVVTERGRGRVLVLERELVNAFASGDVVSWCREARLTGIPTGQIVPMRNLPELLLQ